MCKLTLVREASWETSVKKNKNGNAQLALIAVITCNSLPDKIRRPADSLPTLCSFFPPQFFPPFLIPSLLRRPTFTLFHSY